MVFHLMRAGKKRGHSSLNDVATAISVTSGAVLDWGNFDPFCPIFIENGRK